MKQYKGNIALITVVAMTAISLAGGIALSILSVNYKISTIGFIASTFLEQQLYSCKEEAFRKIAQNTTYTGSGTISFNNGDCTYVVTVNGSNNIHRDILLDADYADYYKSLNLTVNPGTSPITEL
ncbi:hypothetical protein IT417_00085 [bacterium]|nr:hypothetical protein [bacterium]